MKDLFYAELRGRVCEIRTKGFGEETKTLTQLIDMIEKQNNIAKKIWIASLRRGSVQAGRNGD